MTTTPGPVQARDASVGVSLADAVCAEPRLTIVRDATRVVGIELRCRCGQVYNLVCEYGDAAATDHVASNAERA
ncbi:MAG: hypothetical protein NZM03_10065 [Limisphaera sp.]|nr:hypothetical protein [Limisphaera sp.]